MLSDGYFADNCINDNDKWAEIVPASESNEYFDQMTCIIMVNNLLTFSKSTCLENLVFIEWKFEFCWMFYNWNWNEEKLQKTLNISGLCKNTQNLYLECSSLIKNS